MPDLTDYFSLSLPQARDAFYLFRTDTGAGRPALDAAHADLPCKKCGRFDTRAALARGVTHRPMQKWLDGVTSGELLEAVSDAARAAIDRAAPGAVEWFALPDGPGHVPYPTRIFDCPPNTPWQKPVAPEVIGETFRVSGHPCKKCDRMRSVSVRPYWFEPTGEPFDLAALRGCGSDGNDWFTWLASARVAEALSELRGFTFTNLRKERTRMLAWHAARAAEGSAET